MSRTTRAIARLISLVVTVSLAGATLAVASPSMAADDYNVLSIDGEPGDKLSKGKSFVIDEADATMFDPRMYPGDNTVVFDVAAPPGPPWGDFTWTVYLAAPPDEVLTTGTYSGAVDWYARGPGQPGLRVHGNGLACNTLGGDFTIHELSIGYPDIDLVSASFRLRCDESPEPGDLYGEIRYRASSGFKAADAKPFVLDFGEQPSATTTGTKSVTVSAIGAEAISLGSAQIVGADASTFTLESDGCAGATLQPGSDCAIGISARPSSNRTYKADLRLDDDTPRGERRVPLKVKGLGDVVATATISPDKFFPVVDKYKDTIAVKGSRPTAARVDVKVWPAGSPDDIIATGSVPSGTGNYTWRWRGKVDATGELAPAGKYYVAATITEEPDTKVVKERITLSHDWVTWKKKTAVKEGRNIRLWGWSKDGKVTFAKSIYRNGVRLNSGKGHAAVVYVLPVAKSNIYGWMSFEVEGKSTNKRKAVVAAWNPSMGGAKDLGHYDAAKKIGPWKKWWKTGVQGQGRVVDSKVRLAVMNWKGLGGYGRSIFDIKRVRVTYKVGTKHVAPGPAITVPQKPAWVVGPRLAKIAPSRLPSLRKAPLYVPPPIVTDEPSLAVEEPEETTEPAPEPNTESKEDPKAEPEAKPESPPVDEPEPTEPPEPEAEPKDEPTAEPVDELEPLPQA